MRYQCEGAGLVTAAEAYWLGRGNQRLPNKIEALAALKLITGWICEGSGHFEAQHLRDRSPVSPLGRLIAIAFDGTPEEIASAEVGGSEAWFSGPFSRFMSHFEMKGGELGPDIDVD